MRTFSVLTIASTLLALPAGLVACGDDTGDSPTTGGVGANDQGGNGGDGGGGGLPNEFEELQGDITSNMTLTADKAWLLVGEVYVRGATLTIEPGTTVYGDPNTKASLVIMPDAKINAAGTADEPIVFTTASSTKQPGAWGGLVMLGDAPITVDGDGKSGKTAQTEGFTDAPEYGGTNAAHDGGVLQYVRIEYSGVEISDGNEINGLTMAGVGSGTTIDHVMVRYTLDDCFEWFGGNVNASHLVCYRNGDDGFDFDQGYDGNLQFLFLAQDPTVGDDANGFEADSKTALAPGDADHTMPTIYNVTLCGQNMAVPGNQFGMVLRERFAGEMYNVIITGFQAGVDLRDTQENGTPIGGLAYPMLKSSIIFGNEAGELAGAETEAWGQTADVEFSTADPGLAGCFDMIPDPIPTGDVSGGATPVGSFFDTSATYIGAFDPAGESWMTGSWVRFD